MFVQLIKVRIQFCTMVHPWKQNGWKPSPNWRNWILSETFDGIDSGFILPVTTSVFFGIILFPQQLQGLHFYSRTRIKMLTLGYKKKHLSWKGDLSPCDNYQRTQTYCLRRPRLHRFQKHYLTFHLFKNDEPIESVTIAQRNNGSLAIDSQFDKFSELINHFIHYEGQWIQTSLQLSKVMTAKARLLPSRPKMAQRPQRMLIRVIRG